MVSQIEHKKKSYSGKIYTLADKAGNVFYVGCTVTDMQTRLAGHVSEAKANNTYTNPRKNKAIIDLGFEISATIIDIVNVTGITSYDALNNLRKIEKEYILKYMELGYTLTNKEANRVIKSTSVPEHVGQTFEVKGNKITEAIKAA